MPQCTEIRDEFSALLDNELDPETRDTIEAHLLNCSDCLRELDCYKRVTDLYAGTAAVRAPEGFEQDVMAALRPRMGRFSRFPVLRHPAMRWAAALVLLAGGAAVFWLQSGRGEGQLQIARTTAMDESPAAKAGREEADLAPTRMMPQAEPEVAAESPLAFRAMPQEEAAQTFEAAEADFAEPAPAPSVASAPEVAADIAPQTPPPPTAPPAPPADIFRGLGYMESTADAPEAAPVPVAPEARGGAGWKPAPQEVPAARARGEAAGQLDTPERITVAGRDFLRQDKLWRQQGYAGQPTTTLRLETPAHAELLQEHPEIAEIATIGPQVIFRLDETWYHFTTQTEP